MFFLKAKVMVLALLSSIIFSARKGTGKPLWEYETERSKQNAGWLLNADRSHNSAMTFKSTDYGTGPGVERLFSLGAVVSSPLVANGVVYFGSTDGFVYALR